MVLRGLRRRRYDLPGHETTITEKGTPGTFRSENVECREVGVPITKICYDEGLVRKESFEEGEKL